jgi:hypothetical protein
MCRNNEQDESVSVAKSAIVSVCFFILHVFDKIPE